MCFLKVLLYKLGQEQNDQTNKKTMIGKITTTTPPVSMIVCSQIKNKKNAQKNAFFHRIFGIVYL